MRTFDGGVVVRRWGGTSFNIPPSYLTYGPTTLFPFYYNIYYYIFVATLSQPYYHHADRLALSLVDWIIMLRVEEDATEEEEVVLLRRITVY